MSSASADIEDGKIFSKTLHEFNLMADVYKDTRCNVYVDQAVCKHISKLIDAKMDSMVRLVDEKPFMSVSDPLDHAHRLAGALAKLGIVMTDNSARAKVVKFLLHAAEAESAAVFTRKAASSDDDSDWWTVQLSSFETNEARQTVGCFRTLAIFLQFSATHGILHITSHREQGDETSRHHPLTVTLVLEDTMLFTAVTKGHETCLTLFSRPRDGPVEVLDIGFNSTADTQLMKDKLEGMDAITIVRPDG
ncbi:MAG: hypothetical protein Q9183_006518 [Haloplaca sp. 2 TL-2023]